MVRFESPGRTSFATHSCSLEGAERDQRIAKSRQQDIGIGLLRNRPPPHNSWCRYVAGTWDWFQ